MCVCVSVETPLALVGGQCSLFGFDHEGQEQFWTVTGMYLYMDMYMDMDGRIAVVSLDQAIRDASPSPSTGLYIRVI